MVQQLTPPPRKDMAFAKFNNDFEKGTFQLYAKVSPDFSESPTEHSSILSDFDPQLETEKVIANDVVKPLVFILNYMVPFPNRIEFNRTTRRFNLIKASRFRKVLCVLWNVLILWRLCIKISPDSPETSNGVLTYFVKVSYVFFTFFCVVFFHQLWTKGNSITSIFNQCIDSSADLCLKFQSVPRTRLVFLVTHSAWIFCLTFSFTSHVIGGVVFIMNEVTGNKNNSIVFGYDENTETDSDYSLNELSPKYPVIVHCLVVVANFLNTFNWMLSFFYMGSWAMLYRQLFSIFFWRIDALNGSGYELDLPREIRTFNKIVTLLDKYNAFNGMLVLCGAVSCILYISTSIEQAITGVKNLSQFSLRIYLFLSYLPLLTTALMISEVHRKATTFSDVIKKCYNQYEGIKYSRTMEALYGIAIVHHDIGTSNIGFKGQAFFTVTYQFIVAMLSVTITYALVAIQWFPQLNPNTKE